MSRGRDALRCDTSKRWSHPRNRAKRVAESSESSEARQLHRVSRDVVSSVTSQIHMLQTLIHDGFKEEETGSPLHPTDEMRELYGGHFDEVVSRATNSGHSKLTAHSARFCSE